MKAFRNSKVRTGAHARTLRSARRRFVLLAVVTATTLPISAFAGGVSIPDFRAVQNRVAGAGVVAAATGATNQAVTIPMQQGTVFTVDPADPCAERGQARSYKFDLGNSWAGVSGGYEAGALRRSEDCAGDPEKRRGARLFLKSDITGELLRHKIKAYDIEASIELKGETETVSKLRVQFGPHVLIKKEKETIKWTESKNITLFNAEQWILIGFVPVKLQAKLAAVLKGELRLESNVTARAPVVQSRQVLFVAQVASPSVSRPPLIGFKGKVEASLNGSGSAGIDVKVAGAGLAGEFKILKATVTPDLGFLDELMGQFKVCFQPVEVKLNAFLTYWFFGKRKKSRTLASWKSPSYCETLIKF